MIVCEHSEVALFRKFIDEGGVEVEIRLRLSDPSMDIRSVCGYQVRLWISASLVDIPLHSDRSKYF